MLLVEPLPEHTCIVSNDAGGAEILSSLVLSYDNDYSISVSGPALNIFSNKLGGFENQEIHEAISNSELVLLSMGWSDFEFEALKLAKKQKKKTVVYLDHWTGYERRFKRKSVTILPDEIWTGDEYAYELASKIFETVPVKFLKNPYFIDIAERYKNVPQIRNTTDCSVNILYVCEPTAPVEDKERFLGYTSDEALEYFYSCVRTISSKINQITLRPHPSENIEQYKDIYNSDLNVEISTNSDLFVDVASSDIVVGCHSMALIIALLMGKEVYSCIPEKGQPCVLPYKEIQILKCMAS